MRLVLGLTLSRKIVIRESKSKLHEVDLKGLTVSLKTAEKITRQSNFTVSCTKKS